MVKGSQLIHGSPGSLAMHTSVTDYGIAQGGPSVVRGLLSETASAHNDNSMYLANSGDPSVGQSTQMNICDSQ